MTKKILIAVAAVLWISGCQQTSYTINGDPRKFSSLEERDRALLSKSDDIVERIVKLNKPLTTRKLVLVFPSRDFADRNLYEVMLASGSNITLDRISSDPNRRVNYSSSLRDLDAIEKIGIYPVVERKIIDIATEVPPSPDTDVLYLSMPKVSGGIAQWFLDSKRNGKVRINIDRSLATGHERVQSLLDDIKAAAIQ